MDIRPLTPGYAVSPQIDAADLPAVAEAGFAAVIDNRPDSEVGPEHRSDVLAEAARAAGLAYATNPFVHGELTPELVADQRRAAETADGAVLAFCASGTRSAVLWALGERGRRPADDILAATAAAGYPLERLRPQLEQAGP